MLLFCTVRCSNFCRNWVSKVKKPLGLQNRARFEKGIFRSLSAARANLARGGCAAVPFFFVDFGSLSKWPCRCGAEGFSVFSGFFLTPFSKTSSGPLHIPLFFFGCFFSFVRILLGIGGNAALHICFWAVGLQPFLSFGGFWGLLRKTLFFPLKKGYLGSFLSVSFLCLPFVRPWLLSLLFVTLSLSLYLSIFLSLSSFLFFFFLVVLSLFLPSLFFCCFFLSCCFVFVSWEEQLQNITFESLLFIIYFVYFSVSSFKYVLIFVFSLFSLCVLVNINVSNYSKFWFYTLWKVIVFFRAHFDWGNSGWCSRNTVKIGISTHC